MVTTGELLTRASQLNETVLVYEESRGTVKGKVQNMYRSIRLADRMAKAANELNGQLIEYINNLSPLASVDAALDLKQERDRADRLLAENNKYYELRGWLRLCDDDPAGHAEFYRWAAHYFFGDEPPADTEDQPAEGNSE